MQSRLSAGTVILLDDADREAETEAVSGWSELLIWKSHDSNSREVNCGHHNSGLAQSSLRTHIATGNGFVTKNTDT
jgi:hypothetical protein